MKPFGSTVQEIAADELLGVERHHLAAVAGGVVLVAEVHEFIVETEQAVVGERDAVGVAPKIGEYLLGAGEGTLGVDHPGLGVERAEQGRAPAGVSQFRSSAGQAQSG